MKFFSYVGMLCLTLCAVAPAQEALALARQTGAPACIATGLLAVGVAVAETDPGQARACDHDWPVIGHSAPGYAPAGPDDYRRHMRQTP